MNWRDRLTDILLRRTLPPASSNVEDRRHLPPVDLNTVELAPDPHGYRKKYSGTLAASARNIPPGDTNTPLARTLGADADLAALAQAPSYEVWVPPGKSVDIPVKELRDLYGPGETTLRGVTR